MSILNAYACYNKNLEVRLNSSSGGIFYLLASSVFDENGVVYGVAMSKDCYSAEYISVNNKEELKKLQGSKYLQAKIGLTYKNVELDLKKGKRVLFTGTGCQINGLKSFLRKEYDNLICMDIICHGVPSAKLWKKYILIQEQKYGKKLKKINFRCKDNGWKSFGMKEDNIYIPKDKDAYMQFFLRNYSLRPSCYKCQAKEKKLSDITIADFWGIENIVPEIDDGKGVSFIIVRNEKGQNIFSKIKSNLIWKKVKYEDGIKYNSAEYLSVKKPLGREEFFKALDVLTFLEMEKKYISDMRLSFFRNIIRKLKKIIKRILSGGRI